MAIPTDAELLAMAQAAAHHAYVPYSHFPVGAVLLTEGGQVIPGCNVENASYGLTICAERTAVTRMVARQIEDRRIEVAAVVGLKASPCFPCGACRQVLHEFGCRFVVVEEDGEPRRYPFAQILPHGFGPSDLDNS
ncbi:MAG: cytidine deaminase [Austwickia sp.]|nr:cytidine deaminase [Austwickia sp.]MBK8437255.1 cytidine deaminase [Austwickia sp.]MBK9102488.1 cytidine deaminase [Austwickia sp.]